MRRKTKKSNTTRPACVEKVCVRKKSRFISFRAFCARACVRVENSHGWKPNIILGNLCHLAWIVCIALLTRCHKIRMCFFPSFGSVKLGWGSVVTSVWERSWFALDAFHGGNASPLYKTRLQNRKKPEKKHQCGSHSHNANTKPSS